MRSLLMLSCVVAAVVVAACGADDGASSDIENSRRELAKEWITAFAPVRNDIIRAAEKAADAAERLSRSAQSRDAHRRYGGEPLKRMFREASHDLRAAADGMERLPQADGKANALATRMASALDEWGGALTIIARNGDAYAAAQQANEAQADVQEQLDAVVDYIQERGLRLEELPPVIGPSE